MTQNLTYTQCGDYSLTSDWHTRKHSPLANMAECAERS